MLLKLLQLKFGDLAPAVAARVQNAGGDELDRWTAQILDATSVEAALR